MIDLPAETMKAVRSVRHQQNLARLSRLFRSGSAAQPGAHAYADLHPLSLAVACVVRDDRTHRSVDVIVPEVGVSKIFAGIRTALQFACGVADESGLPLRIIALWGAPVGADRAATIQYLDTEFDRRGEATTIVSVDELSGLKVSPDDIWIATHWTTAHPLDIAARLGVVKPEQVIYLVQDYEPGFYPWSTDYALARATYHAGFSLVVNSSPLASYLTEAEGVVISADDVFAPSLDLVRLERAAASRRASDTCRVMFYGRPSRPRNLFAIGMSALRLAAMQLHELGIPSDFVSAGESHPSVELAPGSQLRVLGKTPWDDYFRLLGESDIVLSLQHSPHPSHPPLDAVASGAIAVTNEMGGTRRHLHERLLAEDPDPVDLASAIVRIAIDVRGRDGAAFDADFLGRLGRPIESVVSRASRAAR
jgi:hypothetical protein